MPEAAGAIHSLLLPATKVLPLQNGVEASGQIAAVLGPQHALSGLCRTINMVIAPGRIKHLGFEPAILLGEPDNSNFCENTSLLADALKQSGVTVDRPLDIQKALWDKLLFIAAVSGVGSVTRVSIGELRDCAQSRELLHRVMAEVPL